MRQAVEFPRWWWIWRWVWGVWVLLVCVLLILIFLPALPVTSPPRYDSATVRLPAENGWGSGAAIGPHLVVTAAHVVMIEHTHKVRTQSPDVEIGGKRTVSELLWASEPYDLALIFVPGVFPLKYRNVYCGPTYPGQEIVITGYPAVTDTPTAGAVTTKGVVASNLQHATKDEWRDYVIVDALGAPGASGGGVLDTTGRMIGIFVGMFGQSTRGGGFLPSGYNVMIPSSTLCRLMGR